MKEITKKNKQIEVEYVKGKIGLFEECEDGVYRKIQRVKKEPVYKINSFKSHVGIQYQVVRVCGFNGAFGKHHEKELGVFLNQAYAKQFLKMLQEKKPRIVQ